MLWACNREIVIRTTDRNVRINCQSEHRITEHGRLCSVLSLKFMRDNTAAVSAHSAACCKYILNNKLFIAGKLRLVSGLRQFASYVPMYLCLYSSVYLLQSHIKIVLRQLNRDSSLFITMFITSSVLCSPIVNIENTATVDCHAAQSVTLVSLFGMRFHN